MANKKEKTATPVANDHKTSDDHPVVQDMTPALPAVVAETHRCDCNKQGKKKIPRPKDVFKGILDAADQFGEMSYQLEGSFLHRLDPFDQIGRKKARKYLSWIETAKDDQFAMIADAEANLVLLENALASLTKRLEEANGQEPSVAG